MHSGHGLENFIASSASTIGHVHVKKNQSKLIEGEEKKSSSQLESSNLAETSFVLMNSGLSIVVSKKHQNLFKVKMPF